MGIIGLLALSLLLVTPALSWGSEQSTGTLDIRVINGNDDAEEEVSSGDMSLGSRDLEMIHEDSDQIVGIRFQNVFIPKGSSITNAYITFTADETSSQLTNLTIDAEAADNAAQFSNSGFNISGRTLTDAAVTVNWDNIPAWGQVGETGVKQQTPDLSDLLEEVVNREYWSSGYAMVFIITGTGMRVAESYNGDSSKAPLLHVEYTAEVVERSITQYDDDAEERRDQNGEMSIYSSDLDFVQDRLIGLRFQDITVPRGAEITRAYLVLYVDETHNRRAGIRIDIEMHDDAPAFSNSDDDISNRTLSGNYIQWTPVPHFDSVHEAVITPDLSSLVQQVVGRSGWLSDNSMAFVLEARRGTRVAESFDGAQDHGDLNLVPRLYIEYGVGEVGVDEPIINVDTTSIGASVYENSNPDDDIFTITNTGSGNLEFQISDDADWVTLSSTSGSIETGQSAAITVALSTLGLSVGTHEATITIQDPEALNTPVEIQVSVTVIELPEELACGNLPVYTQNLVSPAILILLDISGSMDDMMDVAPQTRPQTPDLKDIVKEIVDRAGWAENNAMAFIIQGTGKRVAKSYNGSSSEAPLLHVEYSHGGSGHTLEKRISHGNDDAEEYQSGSYVSLGSSDLEMVNDGSRGNLNREPTIYVGANDGFLHAFRLSNGVELWSFMPHNLHSKINNALDDPLFDRCAPEYCHQYYVDGNPIVGDVYADFNGDTNKEWRTMLVVGQREGGQAYFALDVTSGKVFDDADPSKFLWEFSDDQLGETWSDAAIERVEIKDVDKAVATAWGAYLGSGYLPVADQQALKQAYIYGLEAHDASALWRDVNGNSINRYRISPPELGYANLQTAFSVGELVSGQTSNAQGVIIAIDTGTNTLTLDEETGTFQGGEGLVGDQGGDADVSTTMTGTLLNDALASPLPVDIEGDYTSDRIYVGNSYGNMYRISDIGKNMTPKVSTLFTYGNTSPNENPIRAKADYGFGDSNGDIWIYFGSGRYESHADKEDYHQQYFFGLKDSLTPVATYTPQDLVTLQAKFATTQIDGEDKTVRLIAGTNNLAQPWKVQLYEGTFADAPPASGTERVISQPLVAFGLVFFTTFIPDENICAGSGTTWVFALDYNTGLAPSVPLFDLNQDGIYDENDKIDINGERVVPMGVYVGRGQGSKPVLHKNILFITTTGDGLEAIEHPDQGTGQGFFAEKINIEAQVVRLEAWRNK